MKNLVFLGFLAAAAFVGAGLYQGWFTVQQSSDGKSTNYSIKIDNEGLLNSKREFLKSAQDRLRDIADEIDRLRGQTPTPTNAGIAPPAAAGGGDNQATMDQLLAKKKETEKQLNEITNATAENFNEMKQKADRNIDELKSNFRSWKERRRARQ